MEIKYKIWIEKDGKAAFGGGRHDLFKAVEECGSLHSAAKKLHMSYRAAWGRVKESEKRSNLKLVEMHSRGEGMHMTPEAKQIMKRYADLKKKMDSLMEKYGSTVIINGEKDRKSPDKNSKKKRAL
jgi:molybdate transport system regulatory protein